MFGFMRKSSKSLKPDRMQSLKKCTNFLGDLSARYGSGDLLFDKYEITERPVLTSDEILVLSGEEPFASIRYTPEGISINSRNGLEIKLDCENWIFRDPFGGYVGRVNEIGQFIDNYGINWNGSELWVNISRCVEEEAKKRALMDAILIQMFK